MRRLILTVLKSLGNTTFVVTGVWRRMHHGDIALKVCIGTPLKRRRFKAIAKF